MNILLPFFIHQEKCIKPHWDQVYYAWKKYQQHISCPFNSAMFMRLLLLSVALECSLLILFQLAGLSFSQSCTELEKQEPPLQFTFPQSLQLWVGLFGFSFFDWGTKTVAHAVLTSIKKCMLWWWWRGEHKGHKLFSDTWPEPYGQW